jgi:hypothetical protein
MNKQIEQLDEFTKAYLECALWTGTLDDDGSPADEKFNISDFAPEAIAQAIEECQCFQNDNKELLQQMQEYTLESAGHDFWLTMNRHGTGFWDRGLGTIGTKLTDAAHIWGSADIYVGDDGKLYIS